MLESKNDMRLPLISIAEWPDAEVLLLTAFRCWLAGYDTGDIACWELAWQGVSRGRPVAHTKQIIAELGQFTRVFRKTLSQRFVYLPYCCGRITADECLLLQLVTLAQSGELKTAGLVAHKLSNNADHVDLVDAAADLGSALNAAALCLRFAEISGSSIRNSSGLH